MALAPDSLTRCMNLVHNGVLLPVVAQALAFQQPPDVEIQQFFLLHPRTLQAQYLVRSEWYHHCRDCRSINFSIRAELSADVHIAANFLNDMESLAAAIE
ncbi:hypothetical protein E4U55_007645 [Claviceps digitariae]|nr:hypothetical protein E4U55_007645 [Claviceps digitariae]